MKEKNVYKVFLMLSALVAMVLLSCGKRNSNGEKDAETSQTIMVFAGASLTDVLSEIIDSFEVRFEAEVKINLASSGTLARQIEQGGTPDVYISASNKWADYIDSLGFILNGYKSEIARNELVLTAPLNSNLEISVIDSSLNFLSLLGSGRLSIGDPAHVPAGRYARQSLEYFGWYELLKEKILPAKDVRSALMVVEMAEAPVGIVYRTDAQKSEKVKILASFPEETHKPIVYVAGVCKDNKAAKDFFQYLNGEETKTIWKKYGFRK